MTPKHYKALVDAVKTIPKEDRGRMIGMLMNDIPGSEASEEQKEEALNILMQISVDFWTVLDASGANGEDPCASSIDGFLRVAAKIEKLCGIYIPVLLPDILK